MEETNLCQLIGLSFSLCILIHLPIEIIHTFTQNQIIFSVSEHQAAGITFS